MNCCKHDPNDQNEQADHNEQQHQIEHADHNEQQHHKGGHGSHMWMMMLCCGLPLLLLASLPFIDRFIPGSAASLRWIVPFLCPLLMLPMMLGGMREKHDGGSETKLQKQSSEDGKTDSGSCH